VLPSGLEIDIFVPAHNLAIELNGPMHYVPIHGEEKLKRIQLLDKAKSIESHNIGLSLVVIDISNIKGGASSNRISRFLDGYYPEHLRPLLSSSEE